MLIVSVCIFQALFVRLCAPRKTKVPVTPIKHHEQITPVAHAPPPPPLYSSQCAANKPLLNASNNATVMASQAQHQLAPYPHQNHYKHSASSVAPTTPPTLTRPSAPLLLPTPTPTPASTPITRRPAPSPPCANNRKLLDNRDELPSSWKTAQPIRRLGMIQDWGGPVTILLCP